MDMNKQETAKKTAESVAQWIEESTYVNGLGIAHDIIIGLESSDSEVFCEELMLKLKEIR